MSSLFSRRDKVDVPPARAPREGGRTRMAGERPSRTRRRRSEERQRSIEEALEKRKRGRRSRRKGEEERSRSRSRGLVGGTRKNPRPPRQEGERTIVRGPGFSCPDPNMNILMANGSQKKAGELVVGDVVSTYHEKDLEKASKKSLVLASGGTEEYSLLRDQLENSYTKATLGEYKVEFVDIVKDSKKIKLTFEGSKIICSLTHNFYVNDSWKEAKDMVIGDEVSDKKLVAIEDVEDGDVVHITIEDAHTYICEGLLSHNKRRRPPKDKESEVVLDTLRGTGGRRSDPRPPRSEGGSGPRRDPGRGGRTGGRRDEGKMVDSRGGRTGGRRDEGKMVDSRGGRRSDPRREKVYHPIVKSKTPKDQRPVKEDRGPVNIMGRRVDPKPPTGKRDGDPRPPRPEGVRGGRTGGRRSDPRPDRDPNRGRNRGERGRRRVRDEAFARRERSGNKRSMTRRERRRRVRNANTPRIR